MDPASVGYWIFDATLGRLYFRRWPDQSLAALEEVAAVGYDERPLSAQHPFARKMRGLHQAALSLTMRRLVHASRATSPRTHCAPGRSCSQRRSS